MTSILVVGFILAILLAFSIFRKNPFINLAIVMSIFGMFWAVEVADITGGIFMEIGLCMLLVYEYIQITKARRIDN